MSKKGCARRQFQKALRRAAHVVCHLACLEREPVLDIHLRDSRKRWLAGYLAKEVT